MARIEAENKQGREDVEGAVNWRYDARIDDFDDI